MNFYPVVCESCNGASRCGKRFPFAYVPIELANEVDVTVCIDIFGAAVRYPIAHTAPIGHRNTIKFE